MNTIIRAGAETIVARKRPDRVTPRPKRRWHLWLLLPAIYPLAAWVGSSIPVNAAWQQPHDGVTLMVTDNGIHTALIVPLVNEDADWRADFPASDLSASTQPYTHLAIGWGDRQFFLETATWTDVSWHTPIDVISGSGASLLHIDHLMAPAPGPNTRLLVVSHAQYRKIAAAIRAERALSTAIPGYGADDAFYPARETYTPLLTCNTWLGRILRNSDVRMGLWTPFSGGVMKWFPPNAPEAASRT